MTVLMRTYGPAAGCGAALALCFPTWHLFPLAWVALVPFILRNRMAAPGESARQFFVSGLAFYVVLLQWLMSNVYWAGGWAFWGYLGLSALLAFFWAVVGWIWSRVRRLFAPTQLGPVVLAVLWGGMEHLQSFAFSGFGWGALGYSQAADLAFAQWASVGGVPLLSAFLVLSNAWLAEAWAEKRVRIIGVTGVAALALVTHVTGALLLGEPDYASRPFRVALVQSNFPLEMKWDPEYVVEMVRNTAEKSKSLAAGNRVDLIVWPESLIMEDIETPAILEEVSALTRETGAALFAGTHRTNPDTNGSMNSAYFVDSNGIPLDHYDKIHLAPFGEYVPFGAYFPFITKVVPAIGAIEAGSEVKTFLANSRRFGPLICFEVIFPPMARNLRQAGADFLIVITNLGWFGASSAIQQEFQIARMRAIETRMPLVHCANTGISGVFDPWGRFECVNIYFDGYGNMHRVSDVGPARTVKFRLGGVFEVPAPAPHRLASGPRLIPRILLGLAALLFVVAAASPWLARIFHARGQ
ncbi:MAG: apolipoprotein N-acyltransferase [Candidatus Hydrogenedentota bacterium]